MIIDILAVLGGGFTLNAGVLVFLHNRKAKALALTSGAGENGAERCRGCGHAYSYHGKDFGPCAFHRTRIRQARRVKEHDGALVRDLHGFFEYESAAVTERFDECPCQQYDGLIPYKETP